MYPAVYIALFWLVAGTPSAILVFSLHKLGWLSFFNKTTWSGDMDSMVAEHELFWWILLPTLSVLGPIVVFTLIMVGKSEIKRLKQLEQVPVTTNK